MSKRVNKEVNAGVHTNVGMDFQKHSALFLFLEKYRDIKEIRYFIILEHYDDIVFGYLDAHGKVEKIETFQAKKSSKEWKISQLYEIVKKILGNGLLLREDEIAKTEHYSQHQYFVTNQNISLKIKEKKIEYGRLVNASDSEVKFSLLEKPVQDNIKDQLRTTLTCSDVEINELDNITFKYIDLSQKSLSQREQLIGMFHTVFGDTVIDHKAALDTLVYFFHQVETTFNQGNVARLEDSSKRVESTEIEKVVGLVTTKKKAYDTWRRKAEEISRIMQIPLLDQRFFKFHYENSFDKFKDLKEIEHRKILDFVKGKKADFNNFYADEECLSFLLSIFKKNVTTQLTDLQIKAGIYAAYFETKELE